jgi:hypothetical protein
VLTVGGLAGYVAGTTVAYPGRSFSVTVVMVGLAVLAVGRANEGEAEQ